MVRMRNLIKRIAKEAENDAGMEVTSINLSGPKLSTLGYGLPDGFSVFVKSVKDYFALSRSSTSTVDGITVVAARGGGRWHRLTSVHEAWAQQLTWHLKPVTGNDENNGATANTAIKTIAELMRRLPRTRINTYTVNLLESISTSEILLLDGLSDFLGYVNFVGIRTQVATGSVTATDAYNSATKQDGTITDSAKANDFWAAHLGRLVVLTSGANVGAWAWVDKNFAGTKKCRVSMFWNMDLFDVVSPQVGDTYAIYTMPIAWGAKTTVTGGTFSWKDIRFALNDDFLLFAAGNNIFQSCDFDVSCHEIGTAGGVTDLLGCRVACQAMAYAGNANLDGCYMKGVLAEAIAQNGASWQIYGGLMVGTRPFPYAGGLINIYGALAIFDISISPIFVRKGGILQLDAVVYGTGMTAPYSVLVQAAGTVICASAGVLPVFNTPSANYAWVDAVEKSLVTMQTGVSYMNPASGAKIVFQA